jgi:hypothetical protein
MHLQWKPPLETAGVTHHEAVDETTGITFVVECDHPGSPEPWVWYLANYPVVSREPTDNVGPAGRASTKDVATHSEGIGPPQEAAKGALRERTMTGAAASARAWSPANGVGHRDRPEPCPKRNHR